MTPRDQTVIVLYDSGLSYAGVARKMGLSTSNVQDIMRCWAPEKIRGNNELRNTAFEKGLTLKALELYSVGPCTSCECEIVSYTPERGQKCGLCEWGLEA